jgi:hypothetical protein
VIVLAIEAVAGAEILQRWFDIPIWVTSLVLMDDLDEAELRDLLAEAGRRTAPGAV